nr:tetratricopeptide repeat protein [Bacteroidota bacterium]
FSAIANIILQQGDTSRAIEYLEKTISSNPNNPLNHINKANLLLTIKDTTKAIESYNSGLNLDSTNAEVLSSLAGIYIAQRQYKKADMLLNKKLQHHKADQNTAIQSAFLQFKLSNYDSARQSFYQIAQNDPNHYMAYNYISLIEYQKKQYDSAVWYAEKALSLNNEAKESMLTLARVKDINKQYYNALVQYDKIIKLDSTYTIAKVEKANIQKKINNLARSKQQERAPEIPQIQQRF